MNLKHNSLYFKFNILIIVSIFFCGICVGSIFIFNAITSLKQELDEYGKNTIMALNAVISNDVLLDNRFSVYERLMQALNQNEQIRYIIVESPDKKIISTTFPKGLPAGLPTHLDSSSKEEKISKFIFDSNEGRIREIMYTPNNGIIGAIRIGLTENIMMTIIRQRCIQIILTILTVCLMSSLVATYYVWKFLQPIQVMYGALREIAKGNYEISLDKTANDETGRMIHAFNNMARKLSKKEHENSYLMTALKQKEKQNSILMGQLFSAQEDERQRISQELHDGTSQVMVSILTYLRILHDMLTTDKQRAFLAEIRELTSQTLESIRALAVNLHPPLLRDLGLTIAIEKFLDMIEQTQPNIKIAFSYNGDFFKLSDMISLVCYRIIQEAITNVVKHADATIASVNITYHEDTVGIVIIDNGVGFDEETAQKARLNQHLGLRSMQKRIELLNGVFEIESILNKGTKIIITIPIDEEKIK